MSLTQDSNQFLLPGGGGGAINLKNNPHISVWPLNHEVKTNEWSPLSPAIPLLSLKGVCIVNASNLILPSTSIVHWSSQRNVGVRPTLWRHLRSKFKKAFSIWDGLICTDKSSYGHLPSHEKSRTFGLQMIGRGGHLPPEWKGCGTFAPPPPPLNENA